jgi:hypothetical protein
MTERWEFNANSINIGDADHVQRVLNMADQDGWQLVSIVPVPGPTDEHHRATVIWRRPVVGTQTAKALRSERA